MKASHTVWALLIALALGAYIYFFERGPAPQEGGARQLQQVLGYRTDRVWKLELERKGDPLWLVRDKDGRGEVWRIEKPIRAIADPEEARRIVRDLSELMVDRTLTKNIKDLKPFGLDKPAWEFTIATDDGTRHTLLVGGKDPSGSNLYLKRKERDGILVLSAYTIESLQTKKADDLRDKTVIAFDKEKVERFELTAGGKTISVERAGADEWRITAPEKAKARKEKVNSILMTFERLKGTKIVADSPKDLKAYGLEPPQAKVAVWVRGEKMPRVALLGKKEETSGDVYAKAEHNPAVVSVYSYVLSDAETKLEDLKEPEPVKEEKKPANVPANAPPANAPAANAPANAPAPKAEATPPSAPTIDKPLRAKPKKSTANQTPTTEKRRTQAPGSNTTGR